MSLASHRAPTAPAVVAALGAALAACSFALFAAGYIAASVERIPSATPSLELSPTLIARTAIVAALIAIISTALGFPAALAMRARGVEFACVLAAPLILPPYLAHAAWGLIRAPGTPLGDLVQRGDARLFNIINTAQAVLGLSLFAWPIAALVMLPGARRFTDAHLDALSGAQRHAVGRAIFLVSAMRRSIALAFAAVALLMLGSAVPLHVANVETLAIGVWRTLAESASPAAALRAGAPLVVIAVAAGAAFTIIFIYKKQPDAEAGAPIAASRPASLRSPSLAIAACVWAASTIAPTLLMLNSLRDAASLTRTPALIGRAATVGLGVGAVVGVAGIVIAAAAFAGFARNAGRAARTLALLTLAVLIAGALTPGVLVGAAILSASHFPGFDWLAQSTGGIIIAHTLRFGAVAAIAGLWLARTETRDESDLRRLETQESPVAWVRAIGADRLGALAAIGIVMALLSVHEIESAVLVAPPGAPGLAQTLLNQLHYLRMEELSAAGVWMFAIGLGVAALFAAGAALRARAVRTASLLIAATLLVGCGEGPIEPGAPIRVVAQAGELGRAPGQFIYPRAFDTDGESLYIIDKTARVQRWTLAGEPVAVWTMPEFGKGKPTGVTVGPDGLVYVADTHEHRVAVFTPDGEMVGAWGAYGFGPGEFIYPTDITFITTLDGSIERIYVSEYGGNDRVSVFDAQHKFLFSFDGTGAPMLLRTGETPVPLSGSAPLSGVARLSEPCSTREPQLVLHDFNDTEHRRAPPPTDDADPPGAPMLLRTGETPVPLFEHPNTGVRFARPQSIVYDAARDVLYVADASNHRVAVFDADGAFLYSFGRADLLPGDAPGEFRYPYGLFLTHDGTLLVAEFGGHRVRRIDPRTGATLEVFGRGGDGPGELRTPWAVVAVGSRAFVLDSGHNRVVEFHLSRAVGYPATLRAPTNNGGTGVSPVRGRSGAPGDLMSTDGGPAYRRTAPLKSRDTSCSSPLAHGSKNRATPESRAALWAGGAP